MSRRSRLTVEVLIRLPLPAGMKAVQAQHFVREALYEARKRFKSLEPTALESSLPLEQSVTKLVKRETTYL